MAHERTSPALLLSALLLGCGSATPTAAPAPVAEPARIAEATPDRPSVIERARALGLENVQFSSIDLLAPAAISGTMSSREAWKLWQRLTESASDTGLLPVVIAAEMAETWLRSTDELVQFDAESKQTLQQESATERRKVANVGAEAFFEKRADAQAEWKQWLARETKVAPESLPPMSWAELHDRCAKAGIDCPESNPYEPELAEIAARVDATYLGAVERDTPLFIETDLGHDGRLRVLLVDTTLEELPLDLMVGGWNECPFPHEHAVVWQKWAREYGARIVYYGGDTIEMIVDHPPRTVDELRELTREQFLYCTDIVYQGVGSTSELAKALARSRAWYFWWD